MTDIPNQLAQSDPAHGEVLLELGRYDDLPSRDETDEQAHATHVADARTNYQLALRIETVAYQTNLGLGQMLVREHRYSEALSILQAALAIKKCESLDQYTRRVRRAADRQTDRERKKVNQD